MATASLDELKKRFAGVHTLDGIFEILKSEFNDKVSYEDIVDTLVSEDSSKPLSAKQGKVLKDLITSILGTDGEEPGEGGDGESEPGSGGLTVNNSKHFDGRELEDFLLIEQILEDWDDYEDNEDEVKVVSVALVKILKDTIEANHKTLTDHIAAYTEKIAELEADIEDLQSKVEEGFEEISAEEVAGMWEEVKKSVDDPDEEEEDDDEDEDEERDPEKGSDDNESQLEGEPEQGNA